MKQLCECGCGQLAKQGNRFLQFHIAKVMVLSRGPYPAVSDETKRKRRETRRVTVQRKHEGLPKPEPRPCACGCGQETKIVRKTVTARGAIKGQPNKYLHNHHSRATGPAYIEDPVTGCWVWQRQVGRFGYAYTFINRRPKVAHKIYYLAYGGDIPKGCELDHVCHSRDTSCKGGSNCQHRRCVNPAHLEPVPHSENMRRGRSAKLTEEQITKIQHLRITKHLSTKTIADQFDISPQYVSKLTASLGPRIRINT